MLVYQQVLFEEETQQNNYELHDRNSFLSS
jgi:hypothetical protein